MGREGEGKGGGGDGAEDARYQSPMHGIRKGKQTAERTSETSSEGVGCILRAGKGTAGGGGRGTAGRTSVVVTSASPSATRATTSGAVRALVKDEDGVAGDPTGRPPAGATCSDCSSESRRSRRDWMAPGMACIAAAVHTHETCKHAC